jgi:16S rRNA (cytidine1402-2'-O)-methyltransferase
MVFFEAPHRTEAALAAMAEAFGADRPAAVCRELTKTHEEVRRGPLAELVAWAAEGVRGEVTIVVAGRRPERCGRTADPDAWRAGRRDRGRGGDPQGRDPRGGPSAGVPKREVYDAVHKPGLSPPAGRCLGRERLAWAP